MLVDDLGLPSHSLLGVLGCWPRSVIVDLKVIVGGTTVVGAGRDLRRAARKLGGLLSFKTVTASFHQDTILRLTLTCLVCTADGLVLDRIE